MAIALDNLRRGRKYYLRNHGETFEFIVEEVLEENDYRIKDLNTLERYTLQELIQYGIGKDYDLDELEEF